MPAARPITRSKQLIFAALVWVAFFLALESLLWIAGVETVLEREDPSRGFSGLVSVFERDGETFRTRPVAAPYRTFNDQSFLAEKPAKGLRIFALGGSSAYGYPWGAPVAFTAILGDVLATALPDRRVEAINVSGISYAIHRLRFVAAEIMEYEPDLLIVYSGHNEFVEPAFYEALKRRSDEWNRARHALSGSRVYSLLRSLLDRSRNRERSASERFETHVRRNETVVYSAPEKRAIAFLNVTSFLATDVSSHCKMRGLRVGHDKFEVHRSSRCRRAVLAR